MTVGVDWGFKTDCGIDAGRAPTEPTDEVSLHKLARDDRALKIKSFNLGKLIYAQISQRSSMSKIQNIFVATKLTRIRFPQD